MTTVDLADQLLAIGRQLQATERRLIRTSSRLELPPVLRLLLTDPIARLADLLQPFTNWSASQPTADDSARTSTPSRWPPHVSSAPGNSQGGRPWPAAEASATWDQPQGSAAPGEAIRSSLSTPESMDMLSGRTGIVGETQTVSPGQRVRLTRAPSGLLSILQSNMAHLVEPPAVTAPDAAQGTGRDSPPTSGPGHPSDAWSATAYGIPSGVPHMDEHPLYVAVENASMATNNPDDAATALPRMGIAPRQKPTPATLTLDDHLGLPQADIGTEVSLQAVYPTSPGAGEGARGRAGTSGSLPLTPALSQWEREVKGAVGPVAPVMMGPSLWTDETFPPERIDLPHELNAAQLDQIVDALAERLELMLIRAYGTTGA